MLETKCVGEGSKNCASQQPFIFNKSFGHQYSKDFTNIVIQSPLNSSQTFTLLTSLSPLHYTEDFHFVCKACPHRHDMFPNLSQTVWPKPPVYSKQMRH